MDNNSLFPCHITFSARFHYRAEVEVQRHSHPDDYQLQLIYGGSALEMVNGGYIPVSEGDVIFVPQFAEHSFKAGKGGLKTLEIKFVREKNTNPSVFSSFLTRFKDTDNCLYNLFSRLVLEGQKKGLRYRAMCDALLIELLVQIDRICSYGTTEIPTSPIVKSFDEKAKGSPVIAEINTYIYRNINHAFTLREMSEGCGYNQDYIYRTIRKEFGISAVQYVNLLRFEQAKELIEHSELSLSEIAWNLGFDSLQYFSRFFRTHAHLSPSEYSQAVRNTIRNDF